MVSEAFHAWVYPRLQDDFWGVVMPAQQIRVASAGIFTQFFASHTEGNIPTYSSGMQNFNPGMSTPDALTGKPSDVDESWSDAFPGLVGELREAQYTVDVFENRDVVGFVVDTRVYFDGVLWQITPTFTLPRGNVSAFVDIPTTGNQAYVDAVLALGSITDNEWREVAIV